MCGIYCVYKQSRSCQLPFCTSPIFHFEIGDFSVYNIILNWNLHLSSTNRYTMYVATFSTSNENPQNVHFTYYTQDERAM